jgi:hypothetical protein
MYRGIISAGGMLADQVGRVRVRLFAVGQRLVEKGREDEDIIAPNACDGPEAEKVHDADLPVAHHLDEQPVGDWERQHNLQAGAQSQPGAARHDAQVHHDKPDSRSRVGDARSEFREYLARDHVATPKEQHPNAVRPFGGLFREPEHQVGDLSEFRSLLLGPVAWGAETSQGRSEEEPGCQKHRFWIRSHGVAIEIAVLPRKKHPGNGVGSGSERTSAVGNENLILHPRKQKIDGRVWQFALIGQRRVIRVLLAALTKLSCFTDG